MVESHRRESTGTNGDGRALRTYYARHGSKLDIDEQTYADLWRAGIVAVHYPADARGWREESDATSTDPEDYVGSAKSALSRLHEVARDGGYVCAEYEPFDGCLVGYVKPGSEVELVRGRWGAKNDAGDREAILKAVRMTRFKRLTAAESLSLLAARPRQGTFSRWPGAGVRVRDVVEGVQSRVEMGDFTPTQQEVLCSEALRMEEMARHGIPVLEALLLPVGRTLRDVDIYGIGPDGRRVLAQVTNHRYPGKAAEAKLKKLAAYGDPDTVLLFICPASEVAREDSILVVPLDLLFDEFVASGKGQRWLEACQDAFHR